MKKYLVLLAVLTLSAVFAGTSSAFTLKEHEDNIKKYVTAFGKSMEVEKNICEVDGSPVQGIPSGEFDTVRYTQGEADYIVELRPAGDLIQFETKNPNFKLPNGSKVGDPIQDVLHLALVPGDYRRGTHNGMTLHIWDRDGKTTAVAEVNGKIGRIVFINSAPQKGVTINDKYAKFLVAGQKDQPSKDDEAPQAALPPANSELNDSTDAKVIDSYPLPSKEKNMLGIQHRGAYKLYSQNKFKDAYAAFTKLADDFDCNYLSAYWAGATALKLKKNDEARSWFNRALAINPNYRPAQKELDKLDGKKASAPKQQATAEESESNFWALDEKIETYASDIRNFFGDSPEAVQAKLGKPLSTKTRREKNPHDPTITDEYMTLEYDGLWFQFFISGLPDSFTNLIDTTCSSSKYKLKHFNVGDNISKVRKELKDPEPSFSEKGVFRYFAANDYISLVISYGPDNKITSIQSIMFMD